MIELRGFQCDNFTVAVDYHYMVRVYRILNPVRRARPGYSILMLSGIGFNSDQFLLPGTGYLDNISGEYVEFDYNRGGRKVRIECEGEPPQVGRNLAFTLSACGYDVWLGNFRDSLPKDAFNLKVSRDSGNITIMCFLILIPYIQRTIGEYQSISIVKMHTRLSTPS